MHRVVHLLTALEDMNGLVTDVMSSTAGSRKSSVAPFEAAIRAYGDEKRLSDEMPSTQCMAVASICCF